MKIFFVTGQKLESVKLITKKSNDAELYPITCCTRKHYTLHYFQRSFWNYICVIIISIKMWSYFSKLQKSYCMWKHYASCLQSLNATGAHRNSIGLLAGRLTGWLVNALGVEVRWSCWWHTLPHSHTHWVFLKVKDPSLVGHVVGPLGSSWDLYSEMRMMEHASKCSLCHSSPSSSSGIEVQGWILALMFKIIQKCKNSPELHIPRVHWQ